MSEPPITIRAAHDSGTGNLPVHRIVIHSTAGGRGYPRESAAGVARATARYFASQSSTGSAHYVVDAGSAEEHCVPDDTIAWHAPPNSHSIGIEICSEATYTRSQWLSPAVLPALRHAAERTRELCDRHGVPKRRIGPAELRDGLEGICGHVDVTLAFGQSDHTDPGPHFPWDLFMSMVLGTEEEEDVPGYVSVGLTRTQQLSPGQWTTISWGQDFVDPDHQHADEGGPSVLNGPARYSMTASLRITDLPRGTEGQIRAVEVDADNTGRVSEGPAQEFTGSAGDTYVLYALPADFVGDGKRVRLQLIQFGDAPANVAGGSLKILFWRL